MRSHSSGGGGGKSSSSDRSRRDRRAPPPGKPQKIIQAPAFHEKIELQRSENAWVRPSEKAKTMSEEEKAMDISLSILMFKFFLESKWYRKQ